MLFCRQHIEPEQNGSFFAESIIEYIFFNENILVLKQISLKCVPYGPTSYK